jgi:hypothetical protein
MRLRHIVMWAVSLYNIFPHYLITGTTFEEKNYWTQCVLWFPLKYLSETFPFLRIEGTMIINVYWSSCKVPAILVRFKWNVNFLYRFSKDTQIPNFIKIRPVKTEMFHVDRRTDITKLIVAFRNFANAPKQFNLLHYSDYYCTIRRNAFHLRENVFSVV